MPDLREEVTFTNTLQSMQPLPQIQPHHKMRLFAPRAMLWLPAAFKKPDLLSGIMLHFPQGKNGDIQNLIFDVQTPSAFDTGWFRSDPSF